METRSLRRRHFFLFGALAVAVVVIGVVLIVRSRARSRAEAAQVAAAAMRPIPVVMGSVDRRDVSIDLDGLGSVSAYYTVTVKPQVDGRVDAVLYREGDHVKKGQVLVQIDPRPFTIQLENALAARAKDQASLVNATRTLLRDRALMGAGLVNQQQVDDQESTEQQLQAQIQADLAAIHSARLQLDYARVTSPIDGITGVRLVDPGNVVHPADSGGLVVVTTVDPIAVFFTLPEDDLPGIQKAMASGVLPVDAYSRDGADNLGTGRLEVVDNQINQATATLRLKAIFPNPRGALWPNQFVKARLHLETRKDSVVVAAAVIQRGPAGTFAFVVSPSETVTVRPVVVDLIQRDIAVIGLGLTPGERVVVDGQNQLKPNSKVTARPASPPAGAGSSASLETSR